MHSEPIHLTQLEARQFILAKHGLIGPYKFHGKAGILEFIHQVGCIQFDPVDVCGRNADLVLQSRIPDYHPDWLYECLYQDRTLVDYWDKNMSIYAIEDWPYFKRRRDYFAGHRISRQHIDEVSDQIIEILKIKGHATSKDLDFKQSVDWYWAPSSLAKAALESLYYRGDLMIHHKKRAIRSYALTETLLPPDLYAAPDPHDTLAGHHQWCVKRRIGSAGLLWNKASDAWLGIGAFKAADRNHSFTALIGNHELLEVLVDGIQTPLYALKEDAALIRRIQSGDVDLSPRLSFIGPLDNLMWDRKLISALFGFDYKWEIYTPEKDRKYSHYVLPVLYGDTFVGRIEIVRNKKAKALIVRQFWPEPAFSTSAKQKVFKKPLEAALKNFSLFNGTKQVIFE